MVKFTIFKDESYPWRRHFSTKKLLSLNVAHLKQSAFLPFEFANYMPARWAFLNRPLQWLHFSIVLFAAFHMALLFLYTFYVMLAFRTDDIKLTQISDCLVQGCIYCGACNAIVYYRRNQKENQDMINFINTNFKRRSTIGLTYVTIEPTYMLIRILTHTWWGLLMGGSYYACLSPIISQKWELPIPQIIYPFDYQSNNYIFACTFFGQALAQFTLAYAYTNFESIMTSSSMLICGQFDILICSLKNVRHTAKLLQSLDNVYNLKKAQKMLPMDKDIINMDYYSSFEQLEDLDDIDFIQNSMHIDHHRSLVDIKPCALKSTDTFLMDDHRELAVVMRSCILHHKNILIVHQMMERFYNPLIFVCSLQSVLQICNLAYSLSIPATTEILVYNLQYLLLTFIALWVISYAGNCLKVESDRVMHAISNCPWHLCGGPFRRDVLMLMLNTSKPLTLTGGKFFIMDYDKFRAIIQASFSYFTLLQSLG